MKVKIQGEEVLTLKNSISISTALEERSTSSFTVVDIEGKMRFEHGMNVEISHDGYLEFAGIVDFSKEVRVAGSGLFHDITCIDWHYLADKRVVARRYENTFTGDIAKNLVDNYLSFEGVRYVDTTTFKSSRAATFVGTENIGFTGSMLQLKRFSLPVFGAMNAMSTVFDGYTQDLSITTTGNHSNVHRIFDYKTGGVSTYGIIGRNVPIVMTLSKNINPTGGTVGSYTVKIPENSYHVTNSIRSWKVYTYDASGSKILIDSRNNITWSTPGESKLFTVNYNGAINNISFEISMLNGTNDVHLDEIIFYEKPRLHTLEETIISNPLNLSGLGINKGALITWTESIPTGTIVEVETSVDGGVSWEKAVNNALVPKLPTNIEISNVDLRVRVRMAVTDVESLPPFISGITVRFLQDTMSLSQGIEMKEVTFNYIPVSEALQSLAEKTGYWWDITPNKELRFTDRTTMLAPFEINSMSIIKDSLTVENGNNQYRNHQYMIGGKDITDIQIESFKGNGTQQTFTVGYPLAKVPLVYLNNSIQSIGIRGLDDKEGSAKQWFWSKGENTITQNQDHSPISSSDVIRIEYQGEFNVVVLARDLNEVKNTKVIENNSGIVEHVAEDKGLNSREAAFESAKKKLERHGKQGRTIEFSTHMKGLQVGQLATINFPIHDLHKLECLIESVEITYEDEQAVYSVKAVYNISDGSWTKFFYDLATKGRTYVIRENIGDDEVLIMLEVFEKIWKETDSPNMFSALYPSNNTFPSHNTFPTFTTDNRIQYMSFFNDNKEVFRKQITKETTSNDGNRIDTIVNINPNEANMTFNYVGWWGGLKATNTFGTGTLLDKQPINIKKNSNLAYQIEKTDVKGW